MSIQTISAKRLGELCVGGARVELIDVRTPAEYQEVHAAPARNLPLDQINPAAMAQIGAGAANQTLYLICRSGSRSRQACERFAAAGFAQAIGVEGGTEAWEQCGLPVVRGKKAVSLERQVRIAAGSLVLLGTGLGWWIHPAFIGLAAFVGAGLVFSGVTDTCGMAMILARFPWNRAKPASTGSCKT